MKGRQSLADNPGSLFPNVGHPTNNDPNSGVGSGTLGVTRGYVADKTTPAQCTSLLAYTT